MPQRPVDEHTSSNIFHCHAIQQLDIVRQNVVLSFWQAFATSSSSIDELNVGNASLCQKRKPDMYYYNQSRPAILHLTAADHLDSSSIP